MNNPTLLPPHIELLGFAGRIGSGKNYVAEKIVVPMLPEKKTLFLALANHFKVDAIVKCGLDRAKVFGRKDEHTRVTLQRMGTEEGRDKYGADIWVDMLTEWLLLYVGQGYERFVITDVRFPNEVDFIKRNNGVLVRVESPNRSLATAKKEAVLNGTTYEAITGHSSETSLDGYTGYDFIINNDITEFGDVYIEAREVATAIEEKYSHANTFFIDLDDTVCICHKYYMEVRDNVCNMLKGMAMVYEWDEQEIEAVFRFHVDVLQKDLHHRPFAKEKFAKDLSTAAVLTYEQFAAKMTDKALAACALVENEAIQTAAFQLGMQVYDYKYEALEGALHAIDRLQKLGKVVMYTMGDRKEQVKKLAYLGLSHLPVEIFADKNDASYLQMAHKYPSERYFMFGDNYVRDVLPAFRGDANAVFYITKQDRETAQNRLMEYFDTDPDHVGSMFAVESLLEAVEVMEGAYFSLIPSIPEFYDYN